MKFGALKVKLLSGCLVIFVLALALVIGVATSEPVVEWQKTFGGNCDDDHLIAATWCER